MSKVKSRTKNKISTMQRKRAWWGRLFIFPWALGVFWFFLMPMFETIRYSVSKIEVSYDGLTFNFVGLENYLYYFTKDPNFVQNLASSIKSLIFSVPLIVVFSLLVAIVLSSKFRGRTFFRAVFFFPVIIASGVVMSVLTENLLMSTSAVSSTQPAYMFQAPDLNEWLGVLGVPDKVLAFISDLISQVFNLTWKSGVQILLLLAALGGIPSSSYEVADIEGATEWEKFWKITLPTVMPTLIVAVTYSIIDSFTDTTNSVMKMISEQFANSRYENASAIGVVYFLCILVIIGIVNALLFRRRTNYAAD